MSRPIAVRGFEPKDDVAGRLELKSFFRDGGPGDIAAKHFEFVALEINMDYLSGWLIAQLYHLLASSLKGTSFSDSTFFDL
jgi:hypothetical protein